MACARRHTLRPLLALALALAGLLASFAPAEAAGSYSLNLFRSGDFVRQTNLVQCVGASMQMMINIVAPSNDRTAATQLELQTVARSYSSLIGPNRVRRGASVWGWAAGLSQLGYGPYQVVGFPTIDAALHAAARAIRFTGEPVGLLVWRGRHAWVMSGFRATADPRSTDIFRVTDAYVLDPLYPATSSTWGVSPAPGSRLSVATLGQDFVPRRYGQQLTTSTRSSTLGGPYVIVMPVAPLRVAGQLAFPS